MRESPRLARRCVFNRQSHVTDIDHRGGGGTIGGWLLKQDFQVLFDTAMAIANITLDVDSAHQDRTEITFGGPDQVHHGQFGIELLDSEFAARFASLDHQTGNS